MSSPPAIPTVCWHIQLWGPWQRVTQSLHFPYILGRSLLFQVWFHTNDTADSESVVGIKPGDCGVVIRYHIAALSHTWSAECFVAHSHIYPGFTGKVSSITHFPLEPWCEDYSFLDQAVADFEQVLDSILTDSIKTPKLDTSFDELYVITSSVSSGFLHSVKVFKLGTKQSEDKKPSISP